MTKMKDGNHFSLFIFQNDLRTVDNRALDAAAAAGAAVVPVVVRLEKETDARPTTRADDFRNGCIEDVRRTSCKELVTVVGKDFDGVLAEIFASSRIGSVHLNRDPAAPERDERIRAACERMGVGCFVRTDDALLDPAQCVPYRKFTPYYDRYVETARRESSTTTPVVAAKKIRFVACAKKDKDESASASIVDAGQKKTGRDRALAILRRIRAGDFDAYGTTRDELWNADGTTRLGPYINAGCVSVREVFASANGNEPLQRELMWRAFYEQIFHHFPRVRALSPLGADLAADAWTGADDAFERWKRGLTGFPLVDAAMRELASTGHMHNRARMLVASFLVKTLRVDWRRGLRWFEANLVDHYAPSNNGGWQWASGCGADSQPYFRSLSPWLQGKKHDPACVYVKRHVPELASVPAKDIHAWSVAHRSHPDVVDKGYPPPMCDHTAETRKTVALWKKV
jgi:deoxyribodipyrimidine photo-lyase